MERSRHRRFASAVAAVIGVWAVVSPLDPAGAATKLGETFQPTGNCSPRTRLQSTSPGAQYAAPFTGVITSWSFQSSSSGGGSPLSLKIGRGAGGDNFTIVAESQGQSIPDEDAFLTFPARISVQAGDVIGTYAGPPSVFLCTGSATGYIVHQGPFGEDLGVGASSPFTPVNDQQLDVSAALEPDTDSDGFGDETQDNCVGTAGTFDGCPNTVTVDKLKQKGTKPKVKAIVTVPGQGTLKAGAPSDPALAGAAANTLKSATQTLTAKTKQRLALTLKLTKSARRKLARKGKLKVRVKVTYTPTGGPAGSQAGRVKLKS